LSADLGDSGGELCVAVGDGAVNRQRVEPALDRAEPAEPGGAGVVRGDQDTELEFGDADDADSEFTGRGLMSVAIRTLVSSMPRVTGGPTGR
jgi:hypothetical protein